MAAPFWKSKLTDIEQCMLEVKRGKTRILASSAGGRDVYLSEYGEKMNFGRRANYNSACGAGNPAHYARKGQDAKPVLLIVGGVHGGELEGIVAVLNSFICSKPGPITGGNDTTIWLITRTDFGCC